MSFSNGNLKKLIQNLSKTPNEYEWTATAGQTIYTLPPSTNYNPASNWFTVEVGGTTLADSQVSKDSPTQFTLLVNTADIPAGLTVVARWVETTIPATMGHHSTHEAGGYDELDITKLKNYNQVVNAANEYEWTANAGQLTYVMPANTTYDPTSKWLDVTAGGAPIPDSAIQKDSATQFTLLLDPSLIPAGVKIVARWIDAFLPATGGHHVTHEAGGYDEIDITKLKNYNLITKVPNEYEWTATAGQLTYVMPANLSYDPTTKWLEVTVGGAPVADSLIQKDSATQFTLLVNSSMIPAGVIVAARWVDTYIAATAGHHGSHEAGGYDEVDVTKLKNYSSSIASPLADIATNVKTNGITDPTGILDSTTAIQTALNQGGRVIIPSGTYLAGSLVIPSDTQLIGIGKVTIKHNLATGFVATGWDRAMITSGNQPIYTDPSASTRTNAQGVVSNITIENITFDGQNQAVKGVQFIAADYVNVKDVTVKNTQQCSVDLIGIRWSKFNILVDNCAGDAFSLTDKYFGGKRSFSTQVTFDHCIAQNSGSTPSVSDPVPSPFEISDGPSNVYFIYCKALNNNGCGFDFHIHTSDWDLTNINCINCESIGNTMTAINPDVAGFRLGQCPAGSSFKNITYDNCISIGSQVAFKNSAGAEAGYKENVTIKGGYWENTFVSDGTVNVNNSIMYIGKQFRSFKILDANLMGSIDSLAFYTYGTGDGLKISNPTMKGCYVPLYLTHIGGRVELSKVTADVTNPSNALSSIFMSVEADDVIIDGIIAKLDVSKYSSSILRIISTKKNSISGVLLENTGTLGGNAIQFDTVGMATLTGCNIKNFSNGVFFSNTSTSIVSVGNNFKGCTNKYSSTPAYLTDIGNAI